MVWKNYIFIISFIIISACEEEEEPNAENIELLENFVTNDTEYDESGNVKVLRGFSTNLNPKDSEEGSEQAESEEENLKNMYEENGKLFTYVEPEGIDADFSDLILAGGSSLSLLESPLSLDSCKDYSYSEEEVRFNDLVESVDACGEHTFSICIKLSIDGLEESDEKQASSFLLSPSLSINIPCPEKVFENPEITLADSQLSSDVNIVDLQTSLNPLIAEMYLSNDSACESGDWEDVSASKESWPIVWNSEEIEAKIYGKFKDLIFEEISECMPLLTISRSELEALKNINSVVADTTAPTETSIRISADEAYTSSSSVTMTLAASDASSMYITNTSGCASGGSSEAYATSKEWVLGQSNEAANVYVKFRDESLNETTCISDSVIHDSTALIQQVLVLLLEQLTAQVLQFRLPLQLQMKVQWKSI